MIINKAEGLMVADKKPADEGGFFSVVNALWQEKGAQTVKPKSQRVRDNQGIQERNEIHNDAERDFGRDSTAPEQDNVVAENENGNYKYCSPRFWDLLVNEFPNEWFTYKELIELDRREGYFGLSTRTIKFYIGTLMTEGYLDSRNTGYKNEKSFRVIPGKKFERFNLKDRYQSAISKCCSNNFWQKLKQRYAGRWFTKEELIQAEMREHLWDVGEKTIAVYISNLRTGGWLNSRPTGGQEREYMIVENQGNDDPGFFTKKEKAELQALATRVATERGSCRLCGASFSSLNELEQEILLDKLREREVIGVVGEGARGNVFVVYKQVFLGMGID